ncbi:DinB family protein [Bacillus pseudomycoides]|uniref:DinB family protein n=1 Tax=Bacillus pseudomycoides TaxID=64104 RepID=UPI000BF566E0|nr:DinB family protein [Bacillus pseudomycoides]PEP54630.1 damage-inducible protein DinB [Bacillus pseudomycoides]PHC86148.1 damage-inducible protein DinB [Bacillus pseudomycoides]
MNPYVKSVLNQLEIVVESISSIIHQLGEEDLQVQPIATKRSIGELLKHISVICKADYLILNNASREEMDKFYNSIMLYTLLDIEQQLFENFRFLKKNISKYKEEELLEQTTSYWGVTYTRYEWLLEIATHISHHRGQLHTMLSHYGKDLKVQLFE